MGLKVPGKRWIVLIVVTVTVVMIASAVYWLVFPARTSVEPSELLVPDFPAPSTVSATDWQVTTEASRAGNEIGPPRNRLWREFGTAEGDEYGILRHTVVAYGTPLGARYATSREWPGILSHPDIPSAAASDPFESDLADKSHMVCAVTEGVVDECNHWRYVARYGQYTTELDYWYLPISQEEFKMMIAVMEEHIATAFE